MKRLVPVLILLGMIVMAVIAWDNVMSFHRKNTQEYERHIQLAENYMEKKIYVDAATEYKRALKLQPNNYELAMKIVDVYEELGDTNSYLSACSEAIEADQTQLEPYLLLADHYMEISNRSKAYQVLTAAEAAIDSSEIESRLLDLRKEYTTRVITFEETKSFFYENKNGTGYAAVCEDGKWGLINSANMQTINCSYEDIGPLADDVIPVKQDGEYYYMLKNEYRKLVPDHAASWLGAFTNDYAPACIDGKYGYLDKRMHEFHFEFDYAGGFYQNVAAVEKNGKWDLINKEFNTVAGGFDEILLDDYGFCSVYGAVFAKKDGKYALYDLSGNVLAEGFEDAKPFASEQPAAVKKDGKWSFISTAGEIVLETDYADADSFGCGYAPVFDGKKWGCIDKSGNVLIQPVFDALGPFSRNGYAIAEEDDTQEYVVVNLYN